MQDNERWYPFHLRRNLPMQSLGPLVEYAVFGVLIALSIIAVAITLERLRFYRSMQATRYTSRARLRWI